MITRAEYMENSSELFHEFYSQFVTQGTLSFVETNIGLKKLQASKCKHLNDVVEWENGGRNWIWDQSPMNRMLARELGENCSPSTHTCVGKTAARILLKRAADAEGSNPTC